MDIYNVIAIRKAALLKDNFVHILPLVYSYLQFKVQSLTNNFVCYAGMQTGLNRSVVML